MVVVVVVLVIVVIVVMNADLDFDPFESPFSLLSMCEPHVLTMAMLV